MWDVSVQVRKPDQKQNPLSDINPGSTTSKNNKGPGPNCIMNGTFTILNQLRQLWVSKFDVPPPARCFTLAGARSCTYQWTECAQFCLWWPQRDGRIGDAIILFTTRAWPEVLLKLGPPCFLSNRFHEFFIGKYPTGMQTCLEKIHVRALEWLGGALHVPASIGLQLFESIVSPARPKQELIPDSHHPIGSKPSNLPHIETSNIYATPCYL